MSRREDIDNAIWSDPDFEALTLEATTLYIWSWTNPRCGMAGLYKVSERAMTESKVPAERLGDTLAELAAAEFLFYETGVVFIRTRAKHLRQKTTQIAKSIRADVEKIGPEHPLRRRFIEAYADAPWLRDELATLAESDPQPRVGRGSGEGQGSLPKEPNPVTLNRQSGEGQVTLPGNGNGKGKGVEGGSGGRPSLDEPPEHMPTDAAPLLDPLKDVLDRIHTARGGTVPSVRAVGLVLAAYPKRNHLQHAADLEHWLTAGRGQGKPVKDVVSYYRNWIKDEPEATPSKAPRASAPDAERVAMRAALAANRTDP